MISKPTTPTVGAAVRKADRVPPESRGRRVAPPAGGRRGTARLHALTFAACSVIVIGAGVTLRLLAYADRRPLWMDELMLSLGIVTHSFAGLTRQPLDYGQTAPVLFLWCQRLAISLAGVSEWTLRALPLAFGLLLLPLLWSAGRRLLGEQTALLALLLAALSQPLIYYSSEAKQYAADACFTALLIHAVTVVLRAPAEARSWRWLAATGVLAAGFSQPSVFVLFAACVALSFSPPVREAPRWRQRLAAVSTLWAALCALLFATVYRAAAASPYMQRVWAAVFLTPTAPDIAERVHFSVRDVLLQTMLPDWPGATPTAFVIGVLGYLAGAAALWLRRTRDGRAAAALLTLPVAGVFAASALGRYPIATRLVLFLAPAVYLTYGAAVAALLDARPVVRTLPAWVRGLTYAAVLALLVRWRLDGVLDEARHPRRYEDTRDLIASYSRQASPDPVYIFAGGVPSWAFYTTDWSSPDTARLEWMARVASPGGPAFGNRPSRRRRVGREYDELRYPSRGHEEIIGTGAGMEWRERANIPDPDPDEGWAENEARRLYEAVARRADGGRSAWVYFAHEGGTQRDAVLDALRQSGTRVDIVRSANGVVLYRATFPLGRNGTDSSGR